MQDLPCLLTHVLLRYLAMVAHTYVEIDSAPKIRKLGGNIFMWSDPHGQLNEAFLASLDDDQNSPLLSHYNSLAIANGL